MEQRATTMPPKRRFSISAIQKTIPSALAKPGPASTPHNSTKKRLAPTDPPPVRLWETWPAGVRPTAIRRRWFEHLSPLPPDLDLAEIANRLGEPYHTVYRWAQFFRYPFPDRRSWKPSLVDWDKADWSQRDAEIARTLGVSRERVRQIRQKQGIPPATTPIRRFQAFVAANPERLTTMTVQEAVLAAGEPLCLSAGRRILRAAGIRAFRKSSQRRLDWRLPNRDLANIWGLSNHYVATLRLRLGIGPARWDLRGGANITNPEYRTLIQREKLNARRAIREEKAK